MCSRFKVQGMLGLFRVFKVYSGYVQGCVQGVLSLRSNTCSECVQRFVQGIQGLFRVCSTICSRCRKYIQGLINGLYTRVQAAFKGLFRILKKKKNAV